MPSQVDYISQVPNQNYQPLVSAVVPVYNNQETIAETLASIFSQDYKNIEVIVVNDGSTDDTAAVLDRYKDVAKVIHQNNAGSAVARTKGIKNASGKYVAFLDADDLWVPWKISTQVAYLEKNRDIGMVFNSWIELHNSSDQLPESPPDSRLLEEIDEDNSGWLYTRLLMECIIHTSSVVLLKTLCDEVGGFDDNLRRGQDYDYWLRISQLTKITKLKSVLSAYRIHPTSITQKAPDKNFEAILLNKAIKRFGLYDKDGAEISKCMMRERIANSWKSFCWQVYQAGQYSKCFFSALKIIKYRPFWYMGWGYLLASITKMLLTGFKAQAKPTLPQHQAD